jgi:D-alanine-D-alanine ligase
VLDAVEAVVQAVIARGGTVHAEPVRSISPAFDQRLQELNPRLVFNLFEGFDGEPASEGELVSMLEGRDTPFTGAPSCSLFDCVDKGKTKQKLRVLGLPTAEWHVFSPRSPARAHAFQLPFPCIVKPLATDASHGITGQSLVHTFREMCEQVERIHDVYNQAALVEEFLPGREFNVLVMGPPLRVFPVAEIVYSITADKPRLLTYGSKWTEEDEYYTATVARCPADLSEGFGQWIQQLAARAFSGLVGCGYARVDMRTDRSGEVMVLEVNPNPDIGPESGARRQAEAAGLTHQELIWKIISTAVGTPSMGLSSVFPLCNSLRPL